MTLDEAIVHAREVARINRLRTKHPAVHRNDEDEIEACILCAEEHEQLAEWLEELKSIKDGNIPIIHGKAELELHDREIRNKAIDDFTEKLMEQQIYGCMLPDGFRTDIVTSHTIDAIAEQLKVGDGE